MLYKKTAPTTGVNNTSNESATDAGAAYLFSRDETGLWAHQAYLKASNTGTGDQFGYSVAVTGNIVVVGAPHENGSENSAGAAYVFFVANTVPVASMVNITGIAAVGNQLTGNYTYSDADNDLEIISTFRWFRNNVEIAGAISSTYTLVENDRGTNITFEVTPFAASGVNPGEAVISISVLVNSNISPVVNNDFYTINEDGTLIANDADGSVSTSADDGILANDSDIESDILSVVNPGVFNSAIGELVIAANGTFTYTPTADAHGQDVFNLSVTDSINIVATVLTIFVRSVNDQPSFAIIGDIDVSNQVSTIDPVAEFIGFANTIILGPTNEQNIQSIQQFNVNVISDSSDIITNDNISIANNGTLSADMSLNSGTAMLEVSMQDDGCDDFGGINTSTTQQFTLTYSNFIFDDSFESVTLKVISYLETIQGKSFYRDYPSYDFDTDSFKFYGHSLYLNQDYDSEQALNKVKAWTEEILLYKEADTNDSVQENY